jgi:hypothetical protein
MNSQRANTGSQISKLTDPITCFQRKFTVSFDSDAFLRRVAAVDSLSAIFPFTSWQAKRDAHFSKELES